MEKALEQEVRRRAHDLCEYCRTPQIAYRTRHQIDHIIAEKHHGPTQSSNLSLCCLDCNLHKGANIAGIDPLTSQLSRLFHPRQDIWYEHFEWNGPVLVGITPIGRTTIDVLDINNAYRRITRQTLIDEGIFPPSIQGVDRRE